MNRRTLSDFFLEETRCTKCTFTGSWGQPCFITEVLLLLLLLLSNNQPRAQKQAWILSNPPSTTQRCIWFLTSYTSNFKSLPQVERRLVLVPDVTKTLLCPKWGFTSSVWTTGWMCLCSYLTSNDKIVDICFYVDLKSIQALFLLPRSAKQPVDVCCISIKHSLFQRVHLCTVCVSVCLMWSTCT